MSTFEKAANRLEQLRRAGIDIGAVETPSTPVPPTGEVRIEGAPPASQRVTSPVTAKPQPTKGARPVRTFDGGGRGKEAELDLSRMAVGGFITPAALRSRLADEYRVAKRPLLDNVRGSLGGTPDGMNLIMVTSALPGEGKTFTSINLAMSIAMELDSTVLLVDADVARPTLLSALGDEIRMGDTLSTGASFAVVEFADQSRLTIRPHSVISFVMLTSHGESGMVDTLLRLRKGKVQHAVESGGGPRH